MKITHYKAFLLKTFFSLSCQPVEQFGHVVWDAGNRGVSLQEGGAGSEHGLGPPRQQRGSHLPFYTTVLMLGYSLEGKRSRTRRSITDCSLLRSCCPAKPHHAGDAYNKRDTVVIRTTSCSIGPVALVLQQSLAVNVRVMTSKRLRSITDRYRETFRIPI